MIRKLTASTAMLALVTAGAFSIAQAQTEPAQTEEPAIVQQDQITPAESAPAEVAASDETLTPDEPTLATAFIGRSVYSSQDPESDNIGDVNDLIVSDDGTITHAIVGVGGFLGIGEKDVAVPFDELEVVERDGDITLVYAATREQLEAAEQFDRTAYDPGARFAEEQAALAPDPALQPDPAAPAGGMAPAPADDLAATPAPDAETDMATDDTTMEADATPEEMAASEPAADASTEEDLAAAGELPATDTSDAPATEIAAADATAPAGDTGFLSFSADQILASELIGKEVYSAEDESVGEISDLILEDDGKSRVALIDVGGFLGAGEKTVAIPFDQLQFVEQEGGEARVTMAMGRAELEQAPAFELAADQTGTAGVDTEMTADTTAPADTAETDLAATDQPVTDQPTDQPAAEREMVAGAEVESAGSYELATQDLRAEELLGSAVYGTNEENLGEVGDVIFATNGDIEAVVIDVGGFLGIGEKPVAVDFDALNVQKDVNGDVRLMVNASQEQLDGAPSYQQEAAVQ